MFARIGLSVQGFDNLIYHDNITISWLYQNIDISMIWIKNEAAHICDYYGFDS